jgi:hypothetical protein
LTQIFRYSWFFAAMNCMAEELQKPVERNAHTIQSLAFGIPQLFSQCGSSVSSDCSNGRRVLAYGLRQPESGTRRSQASRGYLEVLTNETNAFSTELGLVQAQLNELLAVVQLYQALGGGWQQ